MRAKVLRLISGDPFIKPHHGMIDAFLTRRGAWIAITVWMAVLLAMAYAGTN